MLSFLAFVLLYAPYKVFHFVSYAFHFIKTSAVNDKWVLSQLCTPQQERFLVIRFSTAVLIAVDICFDFRILPLPRQI